jgi:hypothetical protein
MSATEKTKVAKRTRNRERALRIQRNQGEQQTRQNQVSQLTRENTRLKNELATKTAEMDKIKAEFEEYKAQQQQTASPFSSSSYYLAGSPDLLAAPLLPDDPMHPQNNGNNNKNNSHNTNPSTPPHLPRLATATTAPNTVRGGGGEPDLQSVMQWKYPGYYDSNMQFHPYSYNSHNHHQLHEVELEEPPLVFTPFAAAVTSPRDALMLSSSGGGGGTGPGGHGSGHMRGTEFSAWRPQEPGGTSFNNNNNTNNFNHYDYYPQRENSHSARELARMMSSPAAFYNSGPLFASEI